MLYKGDSVMLIQPSNSADQINERKYIEQKQKSGKTDDFQRRVEAEVSFRVQDKVGKIEKKYKEKYLVMHEKVVEQTKREKELLQLVEALK